MGLVLRAQGPGQAAGTSPAGSYPRGQQGPHWRVTFLHLGPQETRPISAQSHMLAAQFLFFCRISAQT